MLKIVLLILLWTVAYAPTSWGWGLRGHHTICEAATFLVKDPDLQFFLKMRAPQMGHLCNVPDTHWKALGPDINQVGSPTHFINPEVLGLETRKVPLVWKDVEKQFKGSTNAFDKKSNLDNLPKQLGSLWWRADQFVRLAVQEGSKGSIKQMMNHMGVLGHYVGDASQPFHSTVDYDGVHAGHTGIHGFYEHDAVAFLDESLLSEIVAEARKLKPKAEGSKSTSSQAAKAAGDFSVTERMRDLSAISVLEAKSLLILDTEKARKKDPSSLKKFKPLIVLQMARSARLLAEFWDEIYLQSKKPDVKEFKDYSFLFQPEFVPPDYL